VRVDDLKVVVRPVRVEEQHGPDRAELTDGPGGGSDVDEPLDQLGELGVVRGLEGDVVKAASASDDVVGQAGGVARYFEGQEDHRVAVAVGERAKTTERRSGRMVDDDQAQTEDVFVEALEPVEVRGVDGDVAETGPGGG